MKNEKKISFFYFMDLPVCTDSYSYTQLPHASINHCTYNMQYNVMKGKASATDRASKSLKLLIQSLQSHIFEWQLHP